MRHATSFLGQILKGELVGVEIGVDEGKNAEEMLKHLNLKKLYLIDSYKGYMGKDGIFYPDDYTDVPSEFNDPEARKKYPVTPKKEAKRIAHERLKEFKDKIVWIEKFSDEAVNDIPNKLDFVYIDGNHNYEYVKDDIKNYWPKLRKGGILCGHDYQDPRHPGVTKAVHEFINNDFTKLKIQLIDWAIINDK